MCNLPMQVSCLPRGHTLARQYSHDDNLPCCTTFSRMSHSPMPAHPPTKTTNKQTHLPIPVIPCDNVLLFPQPQLRARVSRSRRKENVCTPACATLDYPQARKSKFNVRECLIKLCCKTLTFHSLHLLL